MAKSAMEAERGNPHPHFADPQFAEISMIDYKKAMYIHMAGIDIYIAIHLWITILLLYIQLLLLFQPTVLLQCSQTVT
jgi:hypothetical protein